MLMAPEAAPLGATYILLVAVREGGLLLVRFTSMALYNYLKYWITRRKSKHSPGDIELADVSQEEIGEGWVVVQRDANSLSLNDFVFVDGPAATNLLKDLEAASGAPPAVFTGQAEEAPKVTIHASSQQTGDSCASSGSPHVGSTAAAPPLLQHVLDDYPTSTSPQPASSDLRPPSSTGPEHHHHHHEAQAASEPISTA